MTEPTWADYFEYDGLNLIRKPTGSPVSDARDSGKIAGSKHVEGRTSYIYVSLKSKKYAAHRIIWEMVHGDIPDGLNIDHIDGDGTNNKISNLRLVTQSENCKNARLLSSSKTGVSGVTWYKPAGKYQVKIQVNGKQKHLGRFYDFFEATCCRKSAEVEYGFHTNHGRPRTHG